MICIHVLCIEYVCIQYPVKPTGNLTQYTLYKKIDGVWFTRNHFECLGFTRSSYDRPTWGRSPKFQAWHIWFWRPLIWGTVLDTTGLFWIWNCPVFWWDCSFWAILKWLMECEPSTKYGHSHQKRCCFSKKNCSPIDEQWEESSPFGWYIVIHQPEIKEIFGWFPFATNVMTSWWSHCNLNHDQWTEKDMGWYVALSEMWYSKPQIDRKDGDQEMIGETSSNQHPAYFPTYRNYCHSCSHKI